MEEVLREIFQPLVLLLYNTDSSVWGDFVLKFIPFVLFFELPVYIFVLLGVFHYYLRMGSTTPMEPHYHPAVSCVITCYSEGKDVRLTIRSLAEQFYPGYIEIIAIVDGARNNYETYKYASEMSDCVGKIARRSLTVVPKWKRGGRVSSLNTGLQFCRGDIVMAIDGDCSFDNDVVTKAVRHFRDPNVAALAGSLLVRNAFKSLATRFQAIEYLLSIHTCKTGLSEFNMVNNVSGAFGIFRKEILEKIQGWDNGSAEDLDLTLRLKNYFGRHKNFRIEFDPEVVGYTDAPDTFKGFLKQRLRWDGDLFYVYIRKHSMSFNPRLVGWPNFTALLWSGLFFQLVMPFVIIIYSVYMFAVFSFITVVSMWVIVYLFYLLLNLWIYLISIAALPKHPKVAVKLTPYLPAFPIFIFFTRLWSAVACLREIFMKSHLDSAMAPWWVLKKTKF